MIAYKMVHMNDFPSNCRDCDCQWCGLPLKKISMSRKLRKSIGKRDMICVR